MLYGLYSVRNMAACDLHGVWLHTFCVSQDS